MEGEEKGHKEAAWERPRFKGGQQKMNPGLV